MLELHSITRLDPDPQRYRVTMHNTESATLHSATFYIQEKIEDNKTLNEAISLAINKAMDAILKDLHGDSNHGGNHGDIKISDNKQ